MQIQSSYYNNKQSNYNVEDKEKYKKIYKTLAKTYHPDIIKDDGEMMKIVNKLKEEWGIQLPILRGVSILEAPYLYMQLL